MPSRAPAKLERGLRGRRRSAQHRHPSRAGEASYHVAWTDPGSNRRSRAGSGAVFERALELDPKSLPVHLELARLLLEQGSSCAPQDPRRRAHARPFECRAWKAARRGGGGPAEPEPKKPAGGLGGLFGRRR